MGPCRGRHKTRPSITFSVAAEASQMVVHWFKAGNRYPLLAMAGRTVIYAGMGSSHSWTWLADLLEKESAWETRFADEHEFVRMLADGCSTAVVSGGDAYAMASALSGEGFSELKRFISSGGTYVGICAGAYLPLPTSAPPLSEFNLCSTRIENIVTAPPGPRTDSPRLGVPFCDRQIVHPIRGEVALRFGDIDLRAPIYGGPIFCEPSEGRVTGRFSGLANSAVIQVDPSVAHEMILGRPAAVEAEYGDGRLLLFSPHLEHPGYPEANRLFLELVGLTAGSELINVPVGAPGSSSRGVLSRAVADLYVALVGLEGRSFLIGDKMWDSERFLVLAEAVRKRSRGLPQTVERALADRVLSIRKSLLRSSVDNVGEATALLDSLISVARDCVNMRFGNLSDGR
jgi:hypothetical protein